MQVAAAFPDAPAAAVSWPPALPGHPSPVDPVVTERERFELLDDPAEWTSFSQPAGGASAGDAGVWESQLVVSGMHCAACAITLEDLLCGLEGVRFARVSAASGRASVVWSAGLTKPSRWMVPPLALGYRLLPASDAASRAGTVRLAKLALWRWLVAGFCMMQVMMYAFPAYVAAPGDITPDIERLLRWASWVISLPVVLFSCAPFFGNALRDLRHRSIGMDLPVALGIALTFAVSTAATFDPGGWWGREVYFDSLTMFVFFLLTGRWLEHRLRAQTAGSLDKLMQRLPDSVERQMADGQFERVPVRRLVMGDTVRVRPGEAFPADGRIVQGNTSADEALLTGESRPVSRPLGAAVLAGSHNLRAAVHVRIDKMGPDTLYAGIVALMERAAVDKPRLALLADRIARPFLGCVLLAALGALAYGWSADPARALMAAVSVLVVTCPCALSLATPAAMLSSAGLLARRGVLVRHLQALEGLAGIDTVVFDKTGTLTGARMALLAIHCREGVLPAQALSLGAALAQHSLHPVSRALFAAQGACAAGKGGLPLVADVCEYPGRGLEGRLLQSAPPDANGLSGAAGALRLGSSLFCGLEPQVASHDEDCQQVFLADASGWLASFDLAEHLRPEAPEAIASLQAAGIRVEILSGDRDAAVRRVAQRLGIAQAQGSATPQGKLEHMKSLQKRGFNVCMVGDGLNDGPVLAAALVSVAMGDAVPLAQARSDFVLPGGQLGMLPVMLAQARRTLTAVRQNLFWAALYNAVCIPLALAGLLPAWLAGLGMATSSLVVVLNAARLSRLPRPATSS
ncbi:MAG: heavy metal translocating P-type ATPase [Polaromonas sp.]|nr:heavy metal translocating P-type ATPase [Polaromonas sp.]